MISYYIRAEIYGQNFFFPLFVSFFFFFLSTEKLSTLIKGKLGLPMTPTGNCERILALVK